LLRLLLLVGFAPGAFGLSPAESLTPERLGVVYNSDDASSTRVARYYYGSVSEPCNILGKFPDPAVLFNHYLNGDTLLEAYWKSVRMPGQGPFIGEPLARPFARPTSQ